MLYENKRNGKIVRIVQEPDKKYKVVMLQEVSTEDAKPFTVTISTFRRWYKEVPTSAEVPPVQSIVDSEIPEKVDKVDSVESHLKSSQVCVTREDFTDVLDYVDECATARDMTYYVRERQLNVRNYKLPGVKCVVMATVVKRHSVELHCKVKLLSEDVCSKMVSVNHCFNRKYVVTELTSETREFIQKFINNIKVKES